MTIIEELERLLHEHQDLTAMVNGQLLAKDLRELVGRYKPKLDSHIASVRSSGQRWTASDLERWMKIVKQSLAQPAPIDMILHCPSCGKQHVDAPDEVKGVHRPEEWGSPKQLTCSCGNPDPNHVWENPPHRSHLCHGCGNIWRPADVPTNGVLHIQTSGKNDNIRFSRNAIPAQPAPAQSVVPDVSAMVNRFLGWNLPKSFCPDAGITFKPDYNENTPWPMKHEPTGTNLFNADEAKAMFEYCLQGSPPTEAQRDEQELFEAWYLNAVNTPALDTHNFVSAMRAAWDGAIKSVKGEL